MAGWSARALAVLGIATAGLVVHQTGVLPSTADRSDSPVEYPPGASATRADGLGFDTCAAPAVSALRAWRESPYRTVNIHFGGVNRACRQPNLTAAWVRDAAAMGWHLLPTYTGHQPACAHGDSAHRYTVSTATSRGESDAEDAAERAAALGLLPGSALYAAVAHYDRRASCRTAVRDYVSAWTRTLHAAGFLAGVYVHQNSGLRDLSAVYASPDHARPDAVWMARWDGNGSLAGWPTASDTQWATWQRAKQYRGDHDERWGGVTITVDSYALRAPVATVARRYEVTAASALNARAAPSASSPVVRSHGAGSTLPVVCQATGQRHRGTSVWDLLPDGTWVTDRYVSTPSASGFSAALPRCAYPAQVTARALNGRSGPGTSHPTSGTALPEGSLAYVACQASGTRVGATTVWNRLRDGRWVTDHYVSSRSDRTWSSPVPRCP